MAVAFGISNKDAFMKPGSYNKNAQIIINSSSLELKEELLSQHSEEKSKNINAQFSELPSSYNNT